MAGATPAVNCFAGGLSRDLVFLRPGHIISALVLEVIDTRRGADVDAVPPFLVVAEHRRSTISVRLRREPW
jgi:hypothetical protein